MAIDATIPLRGLVQPENPLDTYTKFLQIGNLKAQGQENQFKLSQLARAKQRQDAITKAAQTSGGDKGKFLSEIGKTDPEAAMEYQQKFTEEEAKHLKNASETLGIIGQITSGIKDQATYDQAVQAAQQLGFDQSHLSQMGLGPQYDPNAIEQVKNWSISTKDQIDQKLRATQQKEVERHNVAEEKNQALTNANKPPTVHDMAEGVMQYNHQNQKWERVGGLPKTVPSATFNLGNLVTKTDVSNIADAIESGDQPPTLQGLYRNGAPVRAELARRGVPLARMETDWKAVQKHMATLNGAQQERLRQSITSASDMLDKIDGLYDEWSKLAPTSGYKILNRASLAAMKNLPGRAGAVATALDAQIADLTSDLGNIYMGGNSPTDHSLGLAGQNLKSEWNDETFKEASKQARANLKIRLNSINNSQPAGVSGDSPYLPSNNQQQPPQNADPLGLGSFSK